MPQRHPPRQVPTIDSQDDNGRNFHDLLVAQGYAQAQTVVALIRALPEKLLMANPPRWKRGRMGLPAITPLVKKKALARAGIPPAYLQTSRLGQAWRYIHLVERFPQLGPPMAKDRVLIIERILATLPEAEHEQRLPSLLQASRRQLKEVYREARRRPQRKARARRPRLPVAASPGALWYDRLVEIRQHLLYLKREDLVENLAQSWTIENLVGYLNELRHVIDELRDVERRMKGVERERTTLRVVKGDPCP